MKKIVIIALLCSSALLIGCGKKQTNKILIDSMILTLETTNIYSQANLQQPNIIKAYQTQTTETGAQPASLFIAKGDILSGASIKEFADKNTDTEIKKLTNAEVETSKSLEIKCSNETYPTELRTLVITENNSKQYLSQYYIIQGEIAYIISSMTNNKSENKNIISSFKSITCK